MLSKPYVYAVVMALVAASGSSFAQAPKTGLDHPAHTDSDHAPHASPADTPTSKAHVHGTAHLAVAVDAQEVVMELEIPLMDLVGFEHKPENETERAAFSQTSQTLSQANQLFKFNDSAACVSTLVLVEMPTFEHDSHGDVDARYHFVCKSVIELHSLTVNLFDAFHDIGSLKTVYIDDDSQLAKTLNASQPVFSLH